MALRPRPAWKPGTRWAIMGGTLLAILGGLAGFVAVIATADWFTRRFSALVLAGALPGLLLAMSAWDRHLHGPYLRGRLGAPENGFQAIRRDRRRFDIAMADGQVPRVVAFLDHATGRRSPPASPAALAAARRTAAELEDGGRRGRKFGWGVGLAWAIGYLVVLWSANGYPADLAKAAWMLPSVAIFVVAGYLLANRGVGSGIARWRWARFASRHRIDAWLAWYDQWMQAPAPPAQGPPSTPQGLPPWPAHSAARPEARRDDRGSARPKP